jgi:hypothetical protein
MNRINLIALGAALSIAVLAPSASPAQGKGKGGGKENAGPPAKVENRGYQKADRGQDKGRADDAAKGEKVSRGSSAKAAKVDADGINKGQRGIERRSDRANAVAAGPNPTPAKGSAKLEFLRGKDLQRFNRDLRDDQVRPEFRKFLSSGRASEHVAGGALAYALARGVAPAALLLNPGSDFVELRNRKGNVLFALKDDDARNLGAWRVAPLNDNTDAGAPSFCRSGAGHPVWGRQWCIDKGFGLGSQGNLRWGRTNNVSDLRWNGDRGTGSLTRDALLALLGPTAFNRLALHAVTLGLVDPIAGRWVTDASGQRVLLVSSGAAPVAELADYNNDSIVDLLLVALRGW